MRLHDSCPNLRKVRRDWVMERQAVTTDKDSGIVNNLPTLHIDCGSSKFAAVAESGVSPYSHDRNRVEYDGLTNYIGEPQCLLLKQSAKHST